MSTLKATNLQNASSSSTNLALDTSGNATSAGTVVMSSPYTMRNKIINGAMVIDQRNAGASVTPSTNSYTLDRWFMAYGATTVSTLSVQQSNTAPTDFNTSVKLTVVSTVPSPTTNDSANIRQYIEGYNIVDLNFGSASASNVTMSFWVNSSVTGLFGGAFKNSDASRTYPFNYTINSANVWEKKTITFTGDTTGTWNKTNSTGIIVNFGVCNGGGTAGPAGAWAGANYNTATGCVNLLATNGATFYITGVQLERGTVATPFEYRNYQQELAMCQRYYCKTFSIGTAPGNNVTSTGALKGALRSGTTTEPSANWKFPVSMRTEPTVTLYNTGSGTAGQWSADGAATSSANARSQWISTEGCAMDNTGVAFNNLANIQAAASAEL